jgi:DNA polymerase III alpha subunit (gram-positive type)
MASDNTIILNGTKTTGACPECGDLDCETNHGSGSDGYKMHWTVCPTCGTHMVHVLWDCPHCPPNPVNREALNA